MKVVHVLGNGDSAHIFNKIQRQPRDKLIVCNMPPFAVPDVFGCAIVDFKMMRALAEGVVNLNAYEWILGNRPKKFMEKNSSFYLKHAPHIKEFYTHVPDYAGSATNFNCGLMATHYSCSVLKPDEIHMYGFDSIFDYSMRSSTDIFMESNRGRMNNHRLIELWRPIWQGVFIEHPNIKFVLHHRHDNNKVAFPDNVELKVV